MEASLQNLRVQKGIAVLSVVLFIIKIAAYYITHSIAILSDALESIVNIVAGFIGLFSLYVAAKPQDSSHPYGHGKAEFISAGIEGGLITAAGILILYEAIAGFIAPAPILQLDSGVIFIAITAVMNYAAGWICIHQGKKNNSLALQASGKHLQTDTYSTLGVILGLGIVLLTHLYWLDKLIALLMSFVIMFNGYKIIRSALAGIMDEADAKLLKQIVHTLNQNRSSNWVDIHNLRAIKFGRYLHIDCHLTVPWYFNVLEAHEEVKQMDELVKKKVNDVFEMFIHIDNCEPPNSCSICIKEDCALRQHAFQKKIEWTVKNVLINQKHDAGSLE